MAVTTNQEKTGMPDAGLSTHDVRSLAGNGAPVDSAIASKAFTFAGSNNDLTFTAVAAGPDGNNLRVAITQATGISQAIAVTVDTSAGWLGTIVLGTDGSGNPLTTTAAQAKTAWDASAAVNTATLAYEGTGAGNIAVASVANFTGGAGTGTNSAGKGSQYTDYTNGKLYINGGTKAAPVWKIVTSA